MNNRISRLDQFIKLFFNGNKSDLHRAIELVTGKEYSRQNFSAQINKETLNQELLDGLYALGMNVSWYLYGEGDMFALNDPGIELQKQYEEDLKMNKTAYNEYYSRQSPGNELPVLSPEEMADALNEVKQSEEFSEMLESYKKELLGDIEEKVTEFIKVAAGRVGNKRLKK